MINDSKLEMAELIKEEFNLVVDGKNYYFFLKLTTNERTKGFKSMEEGINLLHDWFNKGVINSTQKLDLITLLMMAPLPHINIQVKTTRKSIIVRWDNVNTLFNNSIHKQKSKFRKTPTPGEL